MTTNYYIKFLLILSLFFCFTLNSFAQIRFVEVNPSTNIVKIKNFGSSTINISTYQLCDFPLYPALNTLTVTNGSLNLSGGAEVTLDISESITMNTGNGELGLYISGPFGTAANMRDYIQWGSSPHTRENVANTALIWVTGTFISSAVPLPYVYTGNGTTTQDGVSFWDPTLSNEEFKIDAFSMSPNPTSSLLILQFSSIIDNGSINIYNILGENIFNKQFALKSNIKIDVSNFSQGLYLIKINNQTKRFVKQ